MVRFKNIEEPLFTASAQNSKFVPSSPRLYEHKLRMEEQVVGVKAEAAVFQNAKH